MKQELKTAKLLTAWIFAAVLLGSGAPTASAHEQGAWEFPWQIMQKMEAREYRLSVVCSGRGAYRYPPNPVPNQGYFLYRHFRCDYEVNWNTWRVACVHTLRDGSIVGRTWALPHSCRF